MADRIANILVFLVFAAMFIVALPGLILWSPVLLVRWVRRRQGRDKDPEGGGLFRPVKVWQRPPGRLAKASAWFKTEEAQGLQTLVSLVVILAGSLIAVFGIGVDPIGVLIVAIPITLGALGVISSRGGGPGG